MTVMQDSLKVSDQGSNPCRGANIQIERNVKFEDRNMDMDFYQWKSFKAICRENSASDILYFEIEESIITNMGPYLPRYMYDEIHDY